MTDTPTKIKKQSNRQLNKINKLGPQWKNIKGHATTAIARSAHTFAQGCAAGPITNDAGIR